MRIINDRRNNISAAINKNAAIPPMTYGGIINDRSKIRRVSSHHQSLVVELWV